MNTPDNVGTTCKAIHCPLIARFYIPSHLLWLHNVVNLRDHARHREPRLRQLEKVLLYTAGHLGDGEGVGTEGRDEDRGEG